MKPNSPCKECEGRRPGCHADCEGYAEYCKVLEAWKQVVREARSEGSEADAFRHHTFYVLQKFGKVGRK